MAEITAAARLWRRRHARCVGRRTRARKCCSTYQGRRLAATALATLCLLERCPHRGCAAAVDDTCGPRQPRGGQRQRQPRGAGRRRSQERARYQGAHSWRILKWLVGGWALVGKRGILLDELAFHLAARCFSPHPWGLSCPASLGRPATMDGGPASARPAAVDAQRQQQAATVDGTSDARLMCCLRIAATF
jgi:hypothetical protein